METMTETKTDWQKLTLSLAKAFETRADRSDREREFVFQNYEELRSNHFFSATIPVELGGGGVPHSEMCDLIRIIGQHCGSTALAFSMHQHLVAAAIWRFKARGESAPMLQKVANERLVLISTGARDWLDSNGEMTRTEGGYLFSAKKHFASQSIGGNVAVTSAPYEHPENGWQVLHFSVPMKSKGVNVLNDWDVMGMRATGSQTIEFKEVFVPDAAIVLARPRTGYHAVWDTIITVAMPLIMSAYVGLAEKAFEIALAIGKKYQRGQQHMPFVIGKMNNSLISARTQWKAMVDLANDLDFKPNDAITNEMLSLKTNVANACIDTVQQAMEGIGGQSFYRKNNLERIFRDVQASPFHPLPAWEQYAFTGGRMLAVK